MLLIVLHQFEHSTLFERPILASLLYSFHSCSKSIKEAQSSRLNLKSSQCFKSPLAVYPATLSACTHRPTYGFTSAILPTSARRWPDIGPVMSWPPATSMESAGNWANAGLALPQHASPTLAQYGSDAGLMPAQCWPNRFAHR